MADAVLYLMDNYSDEKIVNIGVGAVISIHDVALLVKKIVGFEGKILIDSSKPDGAPRKLLDVSVLNCLSWEPKAALLAGLKSTYQWFLKHQNDYWDV